MLPDALAASGTEHAHQVAFFAYCGYARLHGFEEADKWEKGGGTLEWRPEMGYKVPELEWLHANPQGGARADNVKSAQIRGAREKAGGVRAGIPDTFLPVPKLSIGETRTSCPTYRWCGLYIEMKKPDQKPKRSGAGGVSEEQQKFGAYARRVGYGWIVCYSWREAADAVRNYLEW